MRIFMSRPRTESLLRRSFLSHVGIAGIAAAAVGIGEAAPAAAQTNAMRFQAARHSQDDWLDSLPGKHRLFLDAVNGPGAGDALLFAGNFLNANKSGYSLSDNDGAVVV